MTKMVAHYSRKKMVMAILAHEAGLPVGVRQWS